ncbi:MAG: hypothetical protein UIH27_03445 [Ruminococcus sp.]|nr:hypothetical protein [Ruminococcus sp.]
MNYNEWSQEYMESADRIKVIINSLNAQHRRAPKPRQKVLEDKLRMYRSVYRDCLDIARTLRERGGEAA